MKFYGTTKDDFRRQDLPVLTPPWEPVTHISFTDPTMTVGSSYLVFPTQFLPQLRALLADEGWDWDGNPNHPKYRERYGIDEGGLG